MTRTAPEILADQCESFMGGAKRLYDGGRLTGCKGDMWFFELYHHLDACAAALRKSPVQDALTALPSEDEIAALIREYAEVSVDGDDIRVSGGHAAASMILHRVKQSVSMDELERQGYLDDAGSHD